MDHPLGQGIPETEFPILVEQLRQRLNASKEELDLSPKSLTNLDHLLLNYFQLVAASGNVFSEENTVQIVREIAAYFGKVVLSNTKGKLHLVGGLRGTEIEFEGPVKGRKGGETRTYPKAIISLGQIASGTWNAVLNGVDPKLYKSYIFATAKNVKESL